MLVSQAGKIICIYQEYKVKIGNKRNNNSISEVEKAAELKKLNKWFNKDIEELIVKHSDEKDISKKLIKSYLQKSLKSIQILMNYKFSKKIYFFWKW